MVNSLKAPHDLMIANKFFLPSHLLEEPLLDDQIPDEKDILNKL